MPEEIVEFVIPKESLGDYECSPGDKLTLEVTEAGDDGVSVKLVGKEKKSEKDVPMLEDEGLEASFKKGY